MGWLRFPLCHLSCWSPADLGRSGPRSHPGRPCPAAIPGCCDPLPIRGLLFLALRRALSQAVLGGKCAGGVPGGCHDGTHRQRRGPRRILVGVAGSAAAVAAVTWAAREAALRGTVLHAVHAWEPAVRGRAPYAPGVRGLDHSDERKAAGSCCGPWSRRDSVLPQAAWTAWTSWAARTTRMARTTWMARGQAQGIRCSRWSRDRRAGPAALRGRCGTAGARRHPGRGPAGGQPAAHLGPVARACLRAAPCPVVTVAPQHVRKPARVATEPGRRTQLAHPARGAGLMTTSHSRLGSLPFYMSRPWRGPGQAMHRRQRCLELLWDMTDRRTPNVPSSGP